MPETRLALFLKISQREINTPQHTATLTLQHTATQEYFAPEARCALFLSVSQKDMNTPQHTASLTLQHTATQEFFLPEAGRALFLSAVAAASNANDAQVCYGVLQ